MMTTPSPALAVVTTGLTKEFGERKVVDRRSPFRCSVTAIIVGSAYLIPFEAVATRIAPHTATWLPGQLLQAVAAVGLFPDGFAHSLILSGVYVVIGGVVATVVFVREDVTA